MSSLKGFGHEEIQDFDDLIIPFFCKGGRLMSKCESNVNELIVPELVGIPGTVSSRLAEYRDWRGDVQADVSDLETCASNLEIQGLAITAIDFVNPCARYSEVSL